MTSPLPVADLASPEGRRLRRLAGELRAAAAARGADPDLAAAAEFARREPSVPADLRARCLTQARLAARAGTEPDGWLWTDTGLQQSSRPVAAAHRAASLTRRLGRPGRIADLCCGLGVDAQALSAAGWQVIAVEAEPDIAAAARHNVPGLEVRVGRAEDATRDLLSGPGAPTAVYCDPSRRSPGAARRGGRVPPERDPQRWSPRWSWVRDLAATVPTVAKAAPGLPPSLVPDDAEIEWVAVDDEVVEATVWFAPLARSTRRATVLSPGIGVVAEITGRPDDATGSAPDTAPLLGPLLGPTPEIPFLLLEPHPVVVRAALVDALADRVGAARLAVGGRWLTASTPPAAPHDAPLVRAWAVDGELPAPPRRLRGALARLAPASVTFKTADIGRSADDLAREVRLRSTRGGPHLTVALLRVGEGIRAFLVSRLR